ncbi:MAG: histidine kinase [Gammaproteobacteria bacterium]|nr:histidine kinase [Gammaproteobacteria bacterium]
MERLTNSLRVRLTSVVLVIHAALVPLLYLGVSAIVEDGYAELFVNPLRSNSRLIADELEAADAQEFPRYAGALLDSVVLSGQVVFAEITDGAQTLHSSLSSVSPGRARGDDFEFADHGDQVYYISHRVKRGTRWVVLRLGFDEGPTLERIAAAKRRVLAAVLAFTAASIAVAIWLSAVIARPMVRLQEAAKRVAGGDVHTELQMHSSIREVRELNHHLERMRQELVGTNDRLESEIRGREASEQKRLDLERRLLHRERIASIGTLAGGVAHEFNNILTPILLYSQIALDDTAPDGALARDLTRIVAAAHRARSLVNRILTFSREMHSQEPAVFSLRPTVEEALALMRAIVPANIEVDFDASEDGTAVQGDPSLVHQVVINLCTNAYQAMRRTGGRLSVKLRGIDNPGDGQINPGSYALLEVGDTGHGMEQAVILHIFEPFFTTRDVGEGTGLGLSVVHGIVTSMGGSITVESAVGQGTTFRVYLPAAAAQVCERSGALG